VGLPVTVRCLPLPAVARLVIDPQKLTELSVAIAANDNDAAPSLLTPGDDPDDRARTVMRQSNDVDAPPPMPCSWWVHVVLSNPDDLVSDEDARLCLALVRARLRATDGRQASQDAVLALIEAGQGGDSGQPDARALLTLWNENLAFPETIGELHSAIESLAPNAWSTFTALWQQSCGIEPPAKRETGEAIGRCASDAPAEPDGKPDQALPPLPADAPVLEPGLHRELPGMPARVQAFLLHTPKNPPAWRHVESESERGEREFLQDQSCWTGG
jgi:hypothetical protein